MRNLILYGGARRKYQRGGRSLKKKRPWEKKDSWNKIIFYFTSCIPYLIPAPQIAKTKKCPYEISTLTIVLDLSFAAIGIWVFSAVCEPHR